MEIMTAAPRPASPLTLPALERLSEEGRERGVEVVQVY